VTLTRGNQLSEYSIVIAGVLSITSFNRRYFSCRDRKTRSFPVVAP